jgi:caffeoyl-CoA O-methyltransferase
MAVFAGRHRVVELDILEYVAEHSTPPDAVQQELQAATQERTGGMARMQIGHDQAVFMETLVRAMSVRNAIEVGTFTGYSALAIARGLPPDGKLLCLDINEEWGQIAREHWDRAGLAARVELRIGPGADAIRAMPKAGQFDLAFIDADKPAYAEYYEELLPRMRQGGLLLADNTLSNRGVVDPNVHDAATEAMRVFNRELARDPRVRVSILTVGDGLTVAEKL